MALTNLQESEILESLVFILVLQNHYLNLGIVIDTPRQTSILSGIFRISNFSRYLTSNQPLMLLISLSRSKFLLF